MDIPSHANIHLMWGNEHRILYQHTNGNLSRLGNDLIGFIANHILDHGGYQKIQEQLDKTSWVDECATPDTTSIAYYLDLSNRKMNQPATLTIGEERMKKDWYALLRDFQGIHNLLGLFSGLLHHGVCCKHDHKDIDFCYHLNLNTKALSCFSVDSGTYLEVAHIEFKQAPYFRFPEQRV